MGVKSSLWWRHPWDLSGAITGWLDPGYSLPPTSLQGELVQSPAEKSVFRVHLFTGLSFLVPWVHHICNWATLKCISKPEVFFLNSTWRCLKFTCSKLWLPTLTWRLATHSSYRFPLQTTSSFQLMTAPSSKVTQSEVEVWGDTSIFFISFIYFAIHNWLWPSSLVRSTSKQMYFTINTEVCAFVIPQQRSVSTIILEKPCIHSKRAILFELEMMSLLCSNHHFLSIQHEKHPCSQGTVALPSVHPQPFTLLSCLTFLTPAG